MSKTLIPAAGYLRMSSDKQDTSIEGQRSELIAYAAKHNYRIVKWFSDEGISGWKNKERHGFHRLIADAAEGEFKVILCWDQSRFSRFDPMEANYFWHQLRQAGVTIETIKEGKLDFESLGGWLSASVQQHAKSEYCKSLAHDVVRGLRERRLSGLRNSPAPYGYRSDNGKLVLGDAEQIATVRRVFTMRAKGHGARVIMKALNADNIPGPYGRGWNHRTIKMMLARQAYIGHLVFGNERSGKFAHVFDEERVFEDAHPPIIDKALWQKVQAISIRPGQDRRRRHANDAHLAHLLHCGRCGRLMYATGRLRKYVCGTYHLRGECSHNAIKYDVAIAAVGKVLREVLLRGSVEALTAQIELVLAKRKSAKKEADAETLKRQIAEIDRKLESAADRLLDVSTSLVATVQAALQKLQDHRDVLRHKLETASTCKRKALTAKDIAADAWRLDTILQQGDPITVRAALSQIIERIDVEFASKPTVKNPSKDRWIPIGGTIHLCTNTDTFPKCQCRT